MSPARRLAYTALPVAAAILLAAACWSGAQVWLYRLLAAIAIAAFWPALFFVLAFAIAMLLGALSNGHVGGEAAEGIANVGAWAFRRYFGFLRRLRHPVFWGLVLGVTGGLVLGIGVVAMTRARYDARTLHVLDAAAALDEAGFVRVSSGTSTVLDGYARPLRIRRESHFLTVSYELRSAGYDGRFDTDDDLCVVREGKLVRKAKAFLAPHVGEWAALFGELRASTCDPPR